MLEGRRREITKYFPYELMIEEYKEKLTHYKHLTDATIRV